MQYRNYGKLGFQVSALGMGCMRLPLIKDNEGNVDVDKDQAVALIRAAIDKGINYIDNALTYHRSTSEGILGEALSGGYRNKVKIATKQLYTFMKTKDDIRRNLENTLTKLKTDHIDCYLVHNIQAQWWEGIKKDNILAEYEKFKSEGLINYIGFSFHGNFDTFSQVFSYYPWDMCQIQQNMLDVQNEATEAAIHMVGKSNTALVIMEPLKGGGLVNPPPSVQAVYDSSGFERAPLEWAFRHLINYPEISCILSGMSSLDQLEQNIEIFSKPDAVPGCLTDKEKSTMKLAREEYLKINAIPCTGCQYCMPCPNKINIPLIFERYNEGIKFNNFSPSQRWYMIMQRDGSDICNCTACRACEKQCPQQLEIVKSLRIAQEKLAGWKE